MNFLDCETMCIKIFALNGKKRKPVRRAETMTTTEASFFEKRNHMNSTKSQAIKMISG